MKNKYEIRGNTVVIYLHRRDGIDIETVIDREDLQKAQEFKGAWYANWANKKTFYVHGTTMVDGKYAKIHFHRWIMDCPDGLHVDHINHDTLNNKRENLRNVTRTINNQNKTEKVNSSGFSGVSWHKHTGKWQSRIMVNKNNIYLGLFSDIKEAGEAARKARIELMPGYVNNNWDDGERSGNVTRVVG